MLPLFIKPAWALLAFCLDLVFRSTAGFGNDVAEYGPLSTKEFDAKEDTWNIRSFEVADVVGLHSWDHCRESLANQMQNDVFMHMSPSLRAVINADLLEKPRVFKQHVTDLEQ